MLLSTTESPLINNKNFRSRCCYPIERMSTKNVIGFHVKGHQYKRKKWELLTIPERLNIQADEHVENNTKVPINNHIINTSMEIYINGSYTPNNYVASISSSYGEKGAKEFLINKYRWSKSIISDIEWDLHANFIKKKTYSIKKTLLKLTHRWFASRNRNYGQKIMCPHCRQQESTTMDNDHFLTSSSSERRKQPQLNLINTLLQHLNTPPAQSKLIVYGPQSFYNSQLNNIHASDFKAINNQRKIGWKNFSRGTIIKQFTITMNNHYKNTTY